MFDSEKGRVNLSNYGVTDVLTVTRLFPPRPAGGNREMKIQEQCNLAREAFDEYRRKKCDDKGNFKAHNLSIADRVGKIRLRRRVKRKEIVISTTDKSGKFVITTPEINYNQVIYETIKITKYHLRDNIGNPHSLNPIIYLFIYHFWAVKC